MKFVFLVLVAIAFIAVNAQQTTPPKLEGRWDDEVCNLIPNSQQLYRKRTYIYGKFNKLEKGATFEYTESVFSNKDCAVRDENYRIIIAGKYRLTGDRSSTVERFWKIDYAISRKRMEVFTEDFVNKLDNLPGCKFLAKWIPNVEQDITSVNCPTLNIVAKTNCPRLFDIIRRDGKRVWMGEKFVGSNPVRFQEACTKPTRPLTFDRFSYKLFETETISSPSRNTVILRPFITTVTQAPSFDINEVLGNDVATTEGGPVGATPPPSSSGTRIAFATTLLFIIAISLMFM